MASLLLALAVAAGPEGEAVTGTAACREKVTLSGDAVFEATLEDVTRADAPATVIARQRLEPAGALPIAVSIPYDAGQIQPKARYVVRATLQAGKRWWATTAIVPVLTHGAGSKVDLVLKRVSAAAATRSGQAAPAPPEAGTFEGVLPCADCPGLRERLVLFADRAFHLRVEPLERPDGAKDAIGSWTLSSDGEVLALAGVGDALASFDVKDADHLVPLDARGRPADPAARLELVRQDSPSDFEPRLTIRGLLTYKAAAGTFEECLTGRRLTVVAEGDHEALESAYRREGTKAGAPVFAVVEGRIVPRTARRSPTFGVVVDRLVELRPLGSCPPRLAAVPLERTYWRLVQLGGGAVPPNERQPRREAHLLFGSDQGRLVGSDGCNAVVGEYVIDGPRIEFGKLAGTSMACAEMGDRDQAFRQALAEAVTWRTLGPTLELLDGDGERLALFDAATPPGASPRAGAARR